MQTYFNQRAPMLGLGVFCRLLMKIYLILFCSITFALGTNSGISQDAKIAITSKKSISVKQVFRLIHKQTGYKFIFSNDFLANAPNVTLNKGTIKTKDLLENCLSPLNLTFEFTDSQTIVVQRKALQRDKTRTAKKEIQFTITGNVTDIDGEPLVGANIIEKGTTNGTQTDFDGNYSLNLENDQATLIFSYIGFAAKEVSLGGKTLVNVILEEDAAGLEEVVVVKNLI